MRTVVLILVAVSSAAVSAAAVAQSGDIVLVDLADVGAQADAGGADAGADADASASSIVIEGISDELPEVAVAAEPANDRAAMERSVVAHVKWCIATRSVEVSNVDVGFLYLVRKGNRIASLTEVTNDGSLHLSKFHVDVFRMLGETRPIQIGPQRKVFLECIEQVPLGVVPEVTERLSFRIRRGALTLLVEDVAWTPFQ